MQYPYKFYITFDILRGSLNWNNWYLYQLSHSESFPITPTFYSDRDNVCPRWWQLAGCQEQGPGIPGEPHQDLVWLPIDHQAYWGFLRDVPWIRVNRIRSRWSWNKESKMKWAFMLIENCVCWTLYQKVKYAIYDFKPEFIKTVSFFILVIIFLITYQTPFLHRCTLKST